MRIEEYLSLFEEHKSAVRALERVLGIKNGERVNEENLEGKEDLTREYERKKRILIKAEKKLQRAASRITDTRLQSYLLARYICSMKNEEIAYKFNYCERQIYRIAALAKKRLSEELLLEMPTAKRWHRGKRYKRRTRRERRYRKHARR